MNMVKTKRIKITKRDFKKSGLSFVEMGARLDVSHLTLHHWVHKGVPITSAYAVEAVCGIKIIPENLRYVDGDLVIDNK